jgi:hypothetical protein
LGESIAGATSAADYVTTRGRSWWFQKNIALGSSPRAAGRIKEISGQRLQADGIAYLVNGLGGAQPFASSSPMLVEVSSDGAAVTFMAIETNGGW